MNDKKEIQKGIYQGQSQAEELKKGIIGLNICEECGGLSSPKLSDRAEGGSLAALAEILDGEGYAYDVCPECGGRLIRDMAGMGSAGNLLKKFAEKEFPYSFALFDLCADCGRISDVHEKLMGV